MYTFLHACIHVCVCVCVCVCVYVCAHQVCSIILVWLRDFYRDLSDEGLVVMLKAFLGMHRDEWTGENFHTQKKCQLSSKSAVTIAIRDIRHDSSCI